MKLVEILARDLKVWANTTVCYAQSENGKIYPLKSLLGSLDEDNFGVLPNGVSSMDYNGDAKMVRSGELATDQSTAKVTKEMWENERNKLYQWDDKGLPKDGTLCEYALNGGSRWFECEIRYVLNKGDGVFQCVAWCPHLNTEQILESPNDKYTVEFRALNTQKQDAVRGMIDVFELFHTHYEACEALYDAGFRKVEK